jgi:hypothetical protein
MPLPVIRTSYTSGAAMLVLDPTARSIVPGVRVMGVAVRQGAYEAKRFLG